MCASPLCAQRMLILVGPANNFCKALYKIQNGFFSKYFPLLLHHKYLIEVSKFMVILQRTAEGRNCVFWAQHWEVQLV